MMLTHRVIASIVLLLTTVHLPACDQAKKEEVRAALETVFEAANECDGERFVGLLTDASIAQYDRAIELARTGTREQIKARPAAERRPECGPGRQPRLSNICAQQPRRGERTLAPMNPPFLRTTKKGPPAAPAAGDPSNPCEPQLTLMMWYAALFEESVSDSALS
jgi:hypothetical protein